MKLYVSISNPVIAGKIMAVCAGDHGHKIVEVPINADVVIVESRAQVFDNLGMGKTVIQLLWDKRFSSAKDLIEFDRYKNRVFVCNDVGDSYDGAGSILHALFKIQSLKK